MITCTKCGITFSANASYWAHLKAAHPFPEERKQKRAALDPLVRSVKKVRREWRKTPAGRLQTLLEEERKWKRRATIAANKLAEVRWDINRFAEELASSNEELRHVQNQIEKEQG